VIKLNILLLLGTMENGKFIKGSTPKHLLESLYGLTVHERFRVYGQGYRDKIKVRIVTKQEDLYGVRLDDWIVLEDVRVNDYHEVFSNKTDEFLARKKLRGICD
jgi:hypothetical protein